MIMLNFHDIIKEWRIAVCWMNLDKNLSDMYKLSRILHPCIGGGDVFLKKKGG
jgi:hypothetical protein